LGTDDTTVGKRLGPTEDGMRRMASLVEACRALNSSLRLRGVLSRLLDIATKQMDADRSSLFLIQDEAMEVRSEIAQKVESYVIELPIGKGIAGYVAQTGETINVPDAYKDSRFDRTTDDRLGYQTRSILCVPMRNQDGKIIGVLESLNKVSAPSFGAEDEEILQMLADHAAVAIENANQFELLSLHRDRLKEENLELKTALKGRFNYPNIIGASAPMQEAMRTAEKVSQSSATVLLRGESGTGKELFARTIHYHSPQADGPFVPVNCAALPETLLESELFGIEAGTASGVEKRIGKFEQANGGTLFLDEIGDMSLATQAKVLRVIQEREFERVGGRKTIKVDVRIIAATNKDLEQAIKEDHFREDLYYRLSVVTLFVPDLKTRKGDIPDLVDFFVHNFAEANQKRIRGVKPEVVEAFMAYDWPGNVRELENMVERAVVLSQGDVIGLEDLPASVRGAASGSSAPHPPSADPHDLNLQVEQLERHLIVSALEECGMVVARAATQLGLKESTLRSKLKKYGIKAKKGAGPEED
jgi:Nif-specific regulatory protein